jgi:uncharacterized protein with FMN-binding domain
MKKLILSLSVIIFFAFYAFWSTSRTANLAVATPTKTELTVTPAVVPTPTTKASAASSARATKTSIKTTSSENDDGQSDDGEDSSNGTTVVKQPPSTVTTAKPVSTPVATTNTSTASAPIQSAGKFKNGTYTGPVADVYYGNVEIKATISGGKLTDVQFLQYPMDRQTSLQKSTHAMPILKSEAIASQSANVDGVSGATETSKGFVASLGGALAQAAN